jgi:exopolyphosphatase/guanosine-5'-triphosphate,3'-diphosphate pyrophosphatase
MNMASIDIGSNTILLLIAEVRQNSLPIYTLRNEYRAPRISAGLEANSVISNEKIEELLNILSAYKRIAIEHNCEIILLNATNAFRIAKNSNKIIELIKNKLDLEIVVIDGNTEAYYSYLGGKSSLLESNELIVLDIGGGSTEIIYGKFDKIQFKKSFPYGAVNLTEQYLTNNLRTDTNLELLNSELNKIFKELNSISNSNSDLISIAGTPTSLSCIKQNLKEYDDNLVEGSILCYEDILIIVEEMIKISPSDMIKKYGTVVKGREDVLLTGSLILLTVMKNLNIKKTYVSTRGVRYGAIINFIINSL